MTKKDNLQYSAMSNVPEFKYFQAICSSQQKGPSRQHRKQQKSKVGSGDFRTNAKLLAKLLAKLISSTDGIFRFPFLKLVGLSDSGGSLHR